MNNVTTSFANFFINQNVCAHQLSNFSKFNKYVGKYIYVKLRNPVEGLNDYTGTLEEASEEEIKLSYKVKTRTKYVTIEVANITKANLAIKF